jgi:hypothetical protein
VSDEDARGATPEGFLGGKRRRRRASNDIPPTAPFPLPPLPPLPHPAASEAAAEGGVDKEEGNEKESLEERKLRSLSGAAAL